MMKTVRKDAPLIKGIRGYDAVCLSKELSQKSIDFLFLFLTPSQCQHFDLLFTPTFSRMMLDRLSFNYSKENPLVRSSADESNRNERGHLSLSYHWDWERGDSGLLSSLSFLFFCPHDGISWLQHTQGFLIEFRRPRTGRPGWKREKKTHTHTVQTFIQ